MSNVIACFIKVDAIMYTGMTSMQTGIANMNLEQTMYIGRACMNIARAKINTVHDIIHIGIVYIVVLAQISPGYILSCQFDMFLNRQTRM